MDAETEPPVVELTDEDEKRFHAPRAVRDLSAQVLSTSFAKFSTPEMDEGFDDIQYEWQKEAAAKDFLKDWLLNKKRTTRIEDIKPGQMFKDKRAEFQKLTQSWQEKLEAFKAGGAKKPEKKPDEEDDVDIFSVPDVCDVGEEVPLFDLFVYEDWELSKLRFELALLLLSFKTDCNDEDREGMPLDHVNFYCNRYYGEGINTKKYGMTDLKGVLGLVKDTVSIKDGLVHSQLSDGLENLDIFIKLTEQALRDRMRRIDAGDETVRLKFAPPPQPKPKPEPKPVVEAKPEAEAAPNGAAEPGTEPASQGMDEQKGGGKGGKDKSKGWGKDQGKAWGGKDEQKGWGKGGKNEQKGWGKQGGKW